MNPSEPDFSGEIDIEIETACGGKMTLSDDTLRAAYNGDTVYFCLQECKTLFESDPLNSCLADQIRPQVG